MKPCLKQIVSLIMTALMILSTVMCLSGISFAADVVTETEPNDGSNTATVIPVDNVCSGALNSKEDIDWYKFTSDKDYYKLNFSIDPSVDINTIGHGWDIKIYANDGVTLIKEYIGVKSGFTTPILPFETEHLVEVTRNFVLSAPVDCKYNLKIETFEDKYWETENNDTSDIANTIDADSTYKGSFYKPEDIDWFKFTNDKDYFTLDFSLDKTVNYNSVSHGWDIIIYLSDGVTVIKEYRGIKENFTTAVLPFAGDFLVEVKTNFVLGSPVDCVYNLKINTTTDKFWESESNDISKEADSIDVESVYFGSLYSDKDVDWYMFETTSEAFNIDFSLDETASYGNIGDGWDISLFEYGSTESIVKYTNIKEKIVSFDIPYQGKFLIKVEPTFVLSVPVDCVYTLKVTGHDQEEKWESEKNNSTKTARDMVSGESYKANIDNENDIDYFKFKAPETGIINFNFSRELEDSIGDGWKVSVLKADGKVIYTTTVLNDLEINADNIDISKNETIFIKIEPEFVLGAPVYINYAVSVDFLPAPAKVEKLKASSEKTTSVKFSWKEVEGADEYEVAYSTNGKSWKKVTTSKTSITLKNLKSGTTYKVKVRAIDNSVKGKYSSVVTVATKVSKVTLSSVKSTKKAQANVAWKTVTGANGYVVEYSTSKKFSKSTTKTVKVKKGSSKKTTIKKLKSGKKYFVRVKAYKTVNKKAVYGAYSSVKSVKVK